MRKKLLMALVLLFAIFQVSVMAASAMTNSNYTTSGGEMSQKISSQRKIKVTVGGEKIETDVEPVMYNDRILLPVRAVFEKIGADVSYDSSSKKITAKKGKTTVTLTVGKNSMTVNGKKKTIDTAPIVKDNRTLVPIRACAEAFGLDVEWNTDTYTAKIKMAVPVVSERKSGNTIYKYTYDDNGNLILTKGSDGYERKCYYDDNGNEIFLETSGSWYKYAYDSKGNLVYEEKSDGTYTKYEYDANCNLIYKEKSDGTWSRLTCDAYGNQIVESLYIDYTENGMNHYAETRSKYTYDNRENETYREDSDGNWTKRTYDLNGRIIKLESNRFSYTEYQYDSAGNLIYEGNGGKWTKYTYDANGNVIYVEDSNGYWEEYTYDKNNNMTYMKDLYGRWIKREYDKNGNLIYDELLEDGDSGVEWAKYTYDSAGKLTYMEENDGDWEKYIYVVR